MNLSDPLRWNLLEKLGLIGIKAPKAPPSRFTGSGKESAAWRALEQEAADWRAIAVAQQHKIVEMARELVRVTGRDGSRASPNNAAYCARYKAKNEADGRCTWCGEKLPERHPYKKCVGCVGKDRAATTKYRRRLALRRETGELAPKETP